LPPNKNTEGEQKIMHPRPFRFGTIVQVADSKEEWRAKARQVEDLGYAVLLVPDHIGSQPDALNQLAPIPAFLDVLSEGRFELGIGAGWVPSEYQQIGLPDRCPQA
jgi:alkanesulfonate monooxygenase SsuD/methylene tetrahydromethanopterin reductase-like flavin-dependent oxidoreductase (luciferase family)